MKKLLFFLILFVSKSIVAQYNLPVFTVVNNDTADIVKGYFLLIAEDHLMILDKGSNIVFYKKGFHDFSFTLEKNKKMVFTTFGCSYVMDSTFAVIDSFKTKNNIKYDGHDRLILPNGNLLLMGMEIDSIDLKDYPEFKKKWKSDSAFLPNLIIQEQDNQRNAVFEWYSKDHFTLNDVDSFYPKAGLTHSNAFELDEDGNLLLSSRNLNEITKINLKDGSIMWRLGGKHNEFKFVNCPVPFYGQHDIRRLANGHFTFLDNGYNSTSHGARAMEFELDEVNKTATLIWSYTYDKDMYSTGRGNVQRLADGNTLIDFGMEICGDLAFVIVNPKGKLLLQVNGPTAYRVMNYPALPFKLHRPVITCFDSASVKYLDAGTGYKSYKWSTGDTTRIIKVEKAGTYSVFVPYGTGGYISSEKIILSDVTLPCSKKPAFNRNKKTQ